MKKILLILFVAILAIPAFSAKDTITVELDEYMENRDLKQIIDDNAGAKVIKLLRGGYYYSSGIIEVTANLEIVGEKGTNEVAPPILILDTDDTGISPNHMFEAKADLKLENLYLVGVDAAGAYKNFYRTEAEGVRLVVTNCVCNYTNDWNGFFRFASLNGTAIMTNNLVMNMMRQDGYVWATFFHTQNTKPDTLIFTNNTVFNAPNNFLSLNEHQTISPNYAIFEHNTVVNTAKDILHFSYWVNMECKNNLFVNCIYQGDAEVSLAGWTDRVQCPDGEPYAFAKVDTINNTAWKDSVLASLGLDYRVVEITNNNYFQSDAVKAIPGTLTDTSSIAKGHIVEALSPRSKAMFENDSEWPGLVYEDNSMVDPGFKNDPTNIDDLLAQASMLYFNSTGVNSHVDPDKASNPAGYQMTYEWPINFFDFSYTNEALANASTLGYHLGDLYHWYPAEYKNWKQGLVSSADDQLVKGGNQFSVYPNPVKGGIITLNKEASVKIYNLAGQEVISASNTLKVNVSALNAGIYIIKNTEGNFAKFIKK